MSWRVLFGPGPVTEMRDAFEAWLSARADGPLADGQVRFDLIRSAEGELLRVLVNIDAPTERREP